ncbi:MAG: RNA 2',3'-cyclic phosphodiesterase [bacterium]|nr:RNA 2',3'-cyclic phosphodiesterase [bacterium]
MGQRLFLALDIDEDTRGRIVSSAGDVQSDGAWVVWTRPQNLHVTMNFLGDVQDENVDRLCDLIEGVVSGWDHVGDDITFTVGPLVCFPTSKPNKPSRMIWAMVGGPGRDLLADLYTKTNNALAADGWRSEAREFLGHVTVARIKNGDVEAAVRQLPNDELGTVTATELTLYQSDLTNSGPVYTPLKHIQLSRKQ